MNVRLDASAHLTLAEAALKQSEQSRGNPDDRMYYASLANYHATMAVYARIDNLLQVYGQ